MPNWFEEVFISSKIKNTVPWTYLLSMISMVKKLLEHLMKKNCKRLIKNNSAGFPQDFKTQKLGDLRVFKEKIHCFEEIFWQK